MTRWKESDLLKMKAKVQPEPYQLIIGIDCGVKTGFAVWLKKQRMFHALETLMIHQAMDKIRRYKDQGLSMLVRVEDARQVKFKTDIHRAQGAGSVKRDAKIWEDFLTSLQIPFEMVRPNNAITKWTADEFRARTGCTEKTSSHSRDAAMLVYGK